MNRFHSSTNMLFLALSLAASIFGCGGEEAATASATSTSGESPAQAAAPAAVAARTRFIGTWHMSGRRSLPHVPEGLRAILTANPQAANDTLVASASSLTTRKEGRPDSVQNYTVDSETPNGLAITTTSANGTAQHNDITFESDDVVLIVSREMHAGFVFVRDGSPTQAADRAAQPST